MDPHSHGAERVNSFALVTYIPEPLGSFLDSLRTELEPSSLRPRAHVTILPPRPLSKGVTPETAWNWIRACVAPESPFLIRTGEIEVFPGTHVIYVSVQSGFEHVRQLHRDLNCQCLGFAEKFEFHPHITLAQNITEEESLALRQDARKRWEQYTGPREFVAETLTFVQELDNKRWVDLYEMSLRPLAAAR